MSDLDEKLAAYLADRASEKANGVTLEKVYEAQVRLANHFDKHVHDDVVKFESGDNHRASMDRRLIQVEAHVDNLRDDAETTGEHAVEAIAAAARAEGMAARPQRRKSDHPTWLHKALDSAAAKVAVVLVTLALGWLLHHVTIRP